ncbi:NAD-dependent epimerase/dehydratase family protein [Kocuria sp.]|uniref:NAD-dependent epimerase/dehydratase family protein n=1 Tax=Kocuria sp. TaxID=1871328 RepID=UPI0026DF790B|nr:NAD-dependent epimerase/dehydratase family protein [Kocuria sp.]MDO5619140.1 NAD-dependent epimerase/dehydratase family protein [Kocuria sp.]
MNHTIDTAEPVLVTGATGYVAGWIIKGLLEAGVTVHATVRDSSKAKRLAHLNSIAEKSPGRIHFFDADLLTESSFDEAMWDTRVVFHTASPFIRDVTDAQRDLVQPAVQGTTNVLRTANRTPSVRRVVLTSSVAAMFGDASELAATDGHLDESCWNTTSSLTHEPYPYSKTLAEKAAWEIAEEQDQWDLVTVNPALVLGAALNDSPTSDSFSIVEQLMGGLGRFGIPNLTMTVVDVRDVAAAHIAAAYTPEAHGRYLVAAEATDLVDLGRRLKPHTARPRLVATRALPKPLAVLIAPVAGMDRAYARNNIGHPVHVATTRTPDELGVTYRAIDDALGEMVNQLQAVKS